MRNCANCKKELLRRTKGDLCQNCYNFNGIFIMDINNHDDEINKDTSHTSATNDRSMDNKIDNDIPLPDYINVIKQNMMLVKNRDADLIIFLKGQIEFLKDEIKNKNKWLDILMFESAEKKDNVCLAQKDNLRYPNDSNVSTTSSSPSSSSPLSSSSSSSSLSIEYLKSSLSDISSIPLSDTRSSVNNLDNQIDTYRFNKHNEYLASNRKVAESLEDNQHPISSEHTVIDNEQLGTWEKHSNGFGSKMLKKWGLMVKASEKLVMVSHIPCQ